MIKVVRYIYIYLAKRRSRDHEEAQVATVKRQVYMQTQYSMKKKKLLSSMGKEET